jgi:hypothetical protein
VALLALSAESRSPVDPAASSFPIQTDDQASRGEFAHDITACVEVNARSGTDLSNCQGLRNRQEHAAPCLLGFYPCVYTASHYDNALAG